jgi:hypothetical protein
VVNESTSSPYQDKPDPWSSHSIIRGWLRSLPPGAPVLDVGTATGTLGRMCQGQDLLLHGLEPHPQWAEAARPYYHHMLYASLDSAPDDFLAGHRAVVLADVLEHMPAPEAVLRRLIALQPPEAVFMISVPNVANLWVRMNLLFGRFNYTDRGILDRTHLRFFTRRTFLGFLLESGLRVQTLTVTPIPLPLIRPFFSPGNAGAPVYAVFARLTRLFPTLLGYQFVTKSVKP